MDKKQKKLKVSEIIIVEGKDDIAALKRVVDAHIIALNGFSGISKKTIDRLIELSKNNEMILLTDPDFAGKTIRKKISHYVPKIKHAFIPRNEAMKTYSNKINVGVENANDSSILKALKNIVTMKSESETQAEIFDISDLLDNGLSIGTNAKERRIILGDILKIGYYNSKQLLNALNSFNISRDDFEEAIKKINSIIK